MYERFFEFNGKRSTNFNILIQNDFEIEGGDADVSYSSVPGRNLDVPESNNRYKNGAIKYEGFIDIRWFKKGLYDNLSELRRDLIFWLAVNENFGSYTKLIDNLDDKYFYLARSDKKPSLSYLTPKTANLSIEFIVGPLKYRNDGQTFISQEKGNLILNPEPMTSKPLIKIQGKGAINLTINHSTYLLKDIGGLSYIDSETKRVYDESSLKNNIAIFPDYHYPELATGPNEISWDNSSATVEIMPRWRTLI